MPDENQTDEKMEDQKISFLYKAIDDAQAIIRMVDTKAGAVIAFWTVIITIITKLGCEVIVSDLWMKSDIIGVLIILLAGVCVLNSIYLALMTVLPLNAPVYHVENDIPISPKESFYLFSMNPNIEGSLLYFNSKKPKLGLSRGTYEKILSQLNNRKDIISELSYELLKVSFIRNMKLSRINRSLQSILYFFLLAIFFFAYIFASKVFVTGGINMPHLTVNVEFFIVAFVAHLVADYLFQTDKQAIEKSDNINYLLTHSFVYSIIVSVSLFAILNYYSFNTFIVLLLSHIILDNRRLINFWCKFVKRVQNPANLNSLVLSGVDQTFHILIIFLLSLSK